MSRLVDAGSSMLACRSSARSRYRLVDDRQASIVMSRIGIDECVGSCVHMKASFGPYMVSRDTERRREQAGSMHACVRAWIEGAGRQSAHVVQMLQGTLHTCLHSRRQVFCGISAAQSAQGHMGCRSTYLTGSPCMQVFLPFGIRCFW